MLNNYFLKMTPKIQVFDSTVKHEFAQHEFDINQDSINNFKKLIKSKSNNFSSLDSITVYLQERLSDNEISCNVFLFYTTTVFGRDEENMLSVNVIFSRITAIDSKLVDKMFSLFERCKLSNSQPYILGKYKLIVTHELNFSM